jgi:hypothetical protein
MRLGLINNAGTTNPWINAWDEKAKRTAEKTWIKQPLKNHFEYDAIRHLPCQMFQIRILTKSSRKSRLFGESFPDK